MLRIISHSSERFADRAEAGRRLGKELAALKGQGVVVLGIPRGGVVVARELARVLEGDLDIVLARKLRTPGQAELALGSVAEDGQVFLNREVVEELGVDQSYIQQEKEAQLAEILRRTELIRQVLPRLPLEGRVAIVSDDGVATGATTQAALWAVRQERPRKLICAIPVGSEDTVRRLARDTDEIVCLWTPPFFAAVGQFYLRFDQVEDEEMLAILKEEAARRKRKG